MILSDQDLITLNRDHAIIVPFNSTQLQPASYDLTLGNHFFIEMHHPLDKTLIGGNRFSWTKDELVTLAPGEVVLAITDESIHVPNGYAARVEGKSSIGRAGILVHITAGFVDPGYQGKLTLELYNLNNHDVPLRVGMTIAQIVFFKTTSESAKPYGHSQLGSSYQGDSLPMPSTYKWLK